MSRTPVPLALAAAHLAGLLAGACSTFDPPTGALDTALIESLVARHGAAPAAPFERRRARVAVDARDFASEAEGVAVVATAGPPRLALQWIPPLGGKVLDLRVDAGAGDPATLFAEWPQAGRTLVARVDAGTAPRALEVFLAASLLEAATALSPERLRGARRTAEGWEVSLAPRLAGVEVVAVLDEHTRVVARRYRYRGVEWRETIEGETRTLVGRGVVVRVEDESVEALDDVPAALFRPRESP